MKTTAYRIDPETRIYVEDVELTQNSRGAYDVPELHYIDALPDAGPGMLILRNDELNGWVVLPDKRGTAYSTLDGSQVEWSQAGDLPDYLTKKAPGSDTQSWNGDYWQNDEKRVADKKARLLADVMQKITPLRYAIDLEDSTDEEKALYDKLKIYTVALSRVDEKNPSWPVEPNA